MAEISVRTRTVTQYVMRVRVKAISSFDKDHYAYFYCNTRHQAAKKVAFQLAIADMPEGPGDGSAWDTEGNTERWDNFWSLYNKYLDSIEDGNNSDFIELRKQ